MLRRQVAAHNPRPLWPSLLAIAVAVAIYLIHIRMV